MFTDQIKFYAHAGNGGSGIVSWFNYKFQTKAGPAGGNGGRGGSVYIQGIKDLNYLSFYKNKKEFQAKNGQNGGKSLKDGISGEDIILKFPIGSIIKNLKTEQEFEILNIGEKTLILEGGQGGYGNNHFKSSKNTSPGETTRGRYGQESYFEVELNLIADIGLIGQPNAGKSSILNFLTNSNSKIGNYNFTTLDPHLGTIFNKTLADMPGIIEGASEGKGLGLKFLKHINRTKYLAHVLSLENEDLNLAYLTIRQELENYSDILAEKDEIIIITKIDLFLDNKEKMEILKNFNLNYKDKIIFQTSIKKSDSFLELIEYLKKLQS